MTAIKKYLERRSAAADSPVAEAYDTWAAGYDSQPGNLVLDLDKALFASLVKNIDLANKKIADVGCGTGRHWPLLYSFHPSLVMGFDVSEGMLQQLRQKFPFGVTQQITSDELEMIPSASVDCLITTLTIGHIKDITSAIAAWSRVLINGGDLIITDFHPAILANGGKRSFQHGGKTVSVKNYVHPVDEVLALTRRNGLQLLSRQERCIDASVKTYYTEKNAVHVYERFKGLPVIYALHLKKQNAPE